MILPRPESNSPLAGTGKATVWADKVTLFARKFTDSGRKVTLFDRKATVSRNFTLNPVRSVNLLSCTCP